MNDEVRSDWLVLPPAPDRCQTCAMAHNPDDPHNPDSFYYQTVFHMEHGRPATWKDAAAHCPEHVRAVWLPLLNAALEGHGRPTLDDNWEPVASRSDVGSGER